MEMQPLENPKYLINILYSFVYENVLWENLSVVCGQWPRWPVGSKIRAISAGKMYWSNTYQYQPDHILHLNVTTFTSLTETDEDSLKTLQIDYKSTL